MKNKLLILVCLFGFAAGSQAVERYSLGAFAAQGYTCRQAVFTANNMCLEALHVFTETHNVVAAASCPRYACTCYGGTTPARAVCPGQALYEDGQEYEASRRTVVQRFVGQGYSCHHAIHNARADMYAWAWKASDTYAIVDFDVRNLGNCTCNSYGTPTATCSASLTYLHPTSK
ncbi:MAG: hypothetical protein KDD51_16890 [Bdellovibrionales bacterium]|nr:hypothetical protein [Bdellovibrionales bacterium]MCB0417268.1 hypothetical protein [Bdellovibrionales bacterium]